MPVSRACMSSAAFCWLLFIGTWGIWRLLGLVVEATVVEGSFISLFMEVEEFFSGLGYPAIFWLSGFFANHPETGPLGGGALTGFFGHPEKFAVCSPPQRAHLAGVY
ncbi:hypothetical protein AVEN_9648-1 [Araneus ventricosus]|uniref:Uncharacterized protein n=1 Tax=Araneus ventricosus TaxID=182803 RepID=A0A4Y2EXU0_ARAVE|nr:hypothetical protein AVEN_9648-1 [Araneus ventricosus]